MIKGPCASNGDRLHHGQQKETWKTKTDLAQDELAEMNLTCCPHVAEDRGKMEGADCGLMTHRAQRALSK